METLNYWNGNGKEVYIFVVTYRNMRYDNKFNVIEGAFSSKEDADTYSENRSAFLSKCREYKIIAAKINMMLSNILYLCRFGAEEALKKYKIQKLNEKSYKYETRFIRDISIFKEVIDKYKKLFPAEVKRLNAEEINYVFENISNDYLKNSTDVSFEVQKIPFIEK